MSFFVSCPGASQVLPTSYEASQVFPTSVAASQAFRPCTRRLSHEASQVRVRCFPRAPGPRASQVFPTSPEVRVLDDGVPAPALCVRVHADLGCI